MHFSRHRYVTVCQQFLVTAVVAAVGLSAAGVMTLQIVTPEGAGVLGDDDATSAVDVQDAYVDSAPITPKVREVAVKPLAAQSGAVRKNLAPEITAVPKGKKLAAVSEPTKVQGYATVGVTWKGGDVGEDDIAVQVRTKKNGNWSGWTTAEYHDDHGPDAGSIEAARIRPGTDAVVVGDVDAVQMRAQTVDGAAPADLELAIVDPGHGDVEKAAAAIDTSRLPASDAKASDTPPVASTGIESTVDGAGDAAALMAMSVAPKPYIFSRAQWGANESLRDKSSLRYGTVKTGFVHHTVNANDYSEQQVPALIRGIYAYHTQSRGWSDIGYNYLVDRFGRIWEGRYGGVDRPVVGAHTLGYNEYSFAMSAIGNFDQVQPAQAVVDAYAKLFAWKLSLYGIPADKVGVYVKNRYLNAINGHRDVGQTACPGRYLYAKLKEIRGAARYVQVNGRLPSGEPPLTGDPVNWPILPTPAGVPSPVDTLLSAVAQPDIDFPARSNLTRAPWPDAVLKGSSGQITILPMGGMLGYGKAVRNTGTWGAKRYIVAIGDVTGDGKGDVLATTAKTGYARVYPGDGNGHVSNTSVAGTGTDALRNADLIIGAGDVDRDGKRDLIARSKTTRTLLLYRGKGKGVFAAPTALRRDWAFGLTTAADLDRDGRVDLVVVRSDLTMLFMRGLGGTTPSTAFAASKAMLKLPRTPWSISAGADSNGDGKRDVLVRWTSGRGSLYAGNGAGGVGQEFGQFSNLIGLSKVSAAQMMGTSAMDVVARDGAGNLLVLPSNGRTNVTSRITSNLKVPTATQILNVGDWTRNGISDLIVRDAGGDRLVLYPGVGGGKFGRGRALGSGWATVGQLAPVGDVTGDSYPDLMGRIGTTGTLRIFPGKGVNGFATPRKAPATMRTFNQIGSALWGLTGLMFRSADGGFVPLVETTLETVLRMANGSADSSYDTYLGVGDADGDRVPDVLAREKGTGTLWLLPGKTSGGGVQPRMWVANGFSGFQLIG